MIIKELLKTAKMLKNFTPQNLSLCLEEQTTPNTISKYLKVLTMQGCLKKGKRGQYSFAHNGYKTTRKAKKAYMLKAINLQTGDFTAHDIVKKSNGDTREVKSLLKELESEGKLKQVGFKFAVQKKIEIYARVSNDQV